MRKNEGIFIILFLVIIFSPQFLIAETNSSNQGIATYDSSESDYDDVLQNARDCLNEKIQDKTCDKLSTEEKIFSLLSVGKCKQDLIDDSKDNECWPKSSCNVKTTAQAILVLEKKGYDTEKAKEWLLSQTTTPNELEWYLQIDSLNPTSCQISYDSGDYSIFLSEDRSIDRGAGGCLILDYDNPYWLKISQNCYDKEFSISCEESFSTTLIYSKKSSSEFFISENTHSASAEGTTQENVNSLCFKGKTSCDYESSLWATLVLDSFKEDVSKFKPYLISMVDENEKYIPNSFLYLLTDYPDFYSNLLLQQKDSYWDESGDKFYDTALALLTIQLEEPIEKTKTLDWLEEVQGSDGCWDKGNIRNTAFLVYSAWPDQSPKVSVKDDCEDSGFFCMSSVSCSGEILPNYACFGTSVCCSKEKELKTCEELGGDICISGKTCSGVEENSVNGKCCMGTCIQLTTTSECEENLGTCKYTCSEDEESVFYPCSSSGEVCCIQKQKSSLSSWYIWVLLILVILVAIGILYKDKLREYFHKFKLGGSSKPKPRPPRDFPPEPQIQRPIQRRILPPQTQQRPVKRPIKKDNEFDEVLNKLKEMSK